MARCVAWSCGDGKNVSAPALTLAPAVVPAIAWPNWFADCAIDSTKVSDALSELLLVAVTLIATACVPFGIRPVKASIVGSKCNHDGSGARSIGSPRRPAYPRLGR